MSIWMRPRAQSSTRTAQGSISWATRQATVSRTTGSTDAPAALAVAAQGGLASDNTFALNRVDDFDASVPAVSVGAGVLNTQILGQQGAIVDQGANTVIVPF